VVVSSFVSLFWVIDRSIKDMGNVFKGYLDVMMRTMMMRKMMNGFDDVRGSRATTNYIHINDGTATSISNPSFQSNQASEPSEPSHHPRVLQLSQGLHQYLKTSAPQGTDPVIATFPPIESRARITWNAGSLELINLARCPAVPHRSLLGQLTHHRSPSTAPNPPLPTQQQQ